MAMQDLPINWSAFSTKAMQSIKFSDSFINIFEGAVRSSKTVSSIIAWIQFMEESPHYHFLMTGKTENTCYRNVIGGATGIVAIMGKNRAKFKQSGEGGSVLELKFPNPDRETRSKNPWITKICYVVGANDTKSEGKIRGMTIAGWYADEVTLYPESFVKQAINRMSLDGAKAYWTCNPDSPYHYIMEEFISLKKEKGYRVFHFTLDDNKALSDRYKEQLKKAYKGLWYKRMVEGLWVMADGIIYDNFNHDYVEQGGMVCIEKPPKILKYWIGVDYGNSNATVFLLLGLATDDKLYVLDEYYHSGKGDMGKSKSPSQYAEDFIKFLDREDHNGDPIHVLLDKIFIDPSAKGFILELYNKLPKQIRRKITTANNDVLFGIEVVTSLIGNDCVRVHKSCKQVLKELSSYCWNPTAQKVGEDKPIKENDHTLDALRYTTVGTRKIWEKILKIEYKNTRRS